jgi:ProQ/FINO family
MGKGKDTVWRQDFRRGMVESRQAAELLGARWPKAFPEKAHEVRPLAAVGAELREAFGWTPAYAKGVLNAWKQREAYCRAVLRYSIRTKLDGEVIEDAVDDEARAMAKARLDQIAARKAARAAERLAAAAAPPPPPPEPAPEPQPEQPVRARRLLVASPALREAAAKRQLGTTEKVATIRR